MIRKSESGFTLIEVIFVIVLVALISTTVAVKFDSISALRQKSSLRHFVNTWELLYSSSKAKGESHRLFIDLDKQVFYVKREIAKPYATNSQSDTSLDSFRTKSELERRKKEKEKKQDGFSKLPQIGQSDNQNTLQGQLYQKIFSDSNANYDLGAPLDFPSLENEQTLSADLVIKDIKLGSELYQNGIVEVRFNSAGATDFCIIHFGIADQREISYSAVVNPATGKVKIYDKFVDFNQTAADNKK